MNDIFVNLDYNKFAEKLKSVEGKLAELVACRHEYPIWPIHGDNPSDAYEESYHGVIRHHYYQTTIILIGVLRLLRDLA